MPWSMVNIYGALPAFMLVLARVAGLMLAAPLFGGSIIPLQINVVLALAMSLAVFPLLAGNVAVPVTLASAVGGMAGELALGLVIGLGVTLIFAGVQMSIGLGVTLIFAGVQMAAQLVSQQAGLSLGEVFNPLLEAETTVVSQLYYLVAMGLFLAVGGHRAVICALLDSFAVIPVLGFRPDTSLIALLIEILTTSFAIAIRVGGPVMLALMLAFLTLGFVSRTVPQLNLMTVGFPIKLVMALFLMAMTVTSLEPILLDGVNSALDAVRQGLGMPVR